MKRLLLALALLVLTIPVHAADPAAISPQTVTGVVSKVDAKGMSLVVQPTGADGKPSGKAVTLKLAGTSNFYTVTKTEATAAKAAFFSQKEIKAEDLKPSTVIAVTYAKLGKDEVALIGIVVP